MLQWMRSPFGEVIERLRFRAYLVTLAGTSLFTLSSCGDGGGAILTPGDDDDDPPAIDCTANPCGDLVIGLTDADGDFLSYVVDVTSIRLEQSNGDGVQTLPTRQRVDFVDLTDVTELVSVATIPTGTYVGARIRLDYEEAAAVVEATGIPTDTLLSDRDGAPLAEVELDLRFDQANRVVVTEEAPSLLLLEFDLEATHEVTTTSVPALVTVEPFLFASVEPLDAREFRVRGPLVAVNETTGVYSVDLRPFNHRNARLGRLRVRTDSGTRFEVDGEALAQDEGLAALAALGEGTPTVVHGTYDAATGRFNAERVLAGDTVPGVAFDTVSGIVVARDGDTLIVRGGTVIRTNPDDENERVLFARGDVTVELDSGTAVVRDGSDAALDIDAISVGSRIDAFGEATAELDNPTLDATDGRVRLYPTEVAGTVERTLAGQLDLFLLEIAGRDAGSFDFTGTGSVLTDADPDEYEIDTGNLDLSDLEPDDPVSALGFARPFGAAPPDFRARRLTPIDALRAVASVSYGSGGTDAPFMSVGSNGFVLDVGNPDLGGRRFLKVGPVVTDLTLLGTPLTVEPAASGPAVYAVVRQGRVDVFRDFGDFIQRVNNLLAGGSTLGSLTARGRYDRAETTLIANTVTATFRQP